jgi:phosphatidylserine decarboxylase
MAKMTFHREGWATLGVVVAVGGGLLAAVALWGPLWAVALLAVPIAVVLALVLNFFRLPHREPGGQGEGDVLCPSDGKVVVIEEVEETEWFHDRRIQVSIFMSPLNVHAQWAPVAGVVRAAVYHPGKYLVAWHPKSSTENERTTLVIEGPRGPILFRQIAGAVARRICWYIRPDQQVARGEEVGFIKFGSRIDIFLPLDADIQVRLGQKVTGRQTLLARLK